MIVLLCPLELIQPHSSVGGDGEPDQSARPTMSPVEAFVSEAKKQADRVILSREQENGCQLSKRKETRSVAIVAQFRVFQHADDDECDISRDNDELANTETEVAPSTTIGKLSCRCSAHDILDMLNEGCRWFRPCGGIREDCESRDGDRWDSHALDCRGDVSRYSSCRGISSRFDRDRRVRLTLTASVTFEKRPLFFIGRRLPKIFFYLPSQSPSTRPYQFEEIRQAIQYTDTRERNPGVSVISLPFWVDRIGVVYLKLRRNCRREVGHPCKRVWRSDGGYRKEFRR